MVWARERQLPLPVTFWQLLVLGWALTLAFGFATVVLPGRAIIGFLGAFILIGGVAALALRIRTSPHDSLSASVRNRAIVLGVLNIALGVAFILLMITQS